MDTTELINILFCNDVKPLKSIQVSFEGIETTRELFETLLTIFTEGMKIHFSVNGKVDLNSITLKEFEKMVHYFSSIGIMIYFHKFHIKQLEDMENELCNPNIHYKYDIFNKDITDEYINKNYQDIPLPEYFVYYKHIKTTKLIDYKFQIRVIDNIYVIYFKFL